MKKILKNKKLIKALIYTLELLCIVLVLYLVILPLYPEIKYRLMPKVEENDKSFEEFLSIPVREKSDIFTDNQFPESNFDVSANRLIIKKIGVNAPIVQTSNEAYGLSLGAWLTPDGLVPGQGGNIILTGHRFKYLPPSNLTFYLFHKLEVGDQVYIDWKDSNYFYKVKEIKIIEDTDLSILKPTKNETLTMYTCHPIYSSKKRLVVISELVEVVENK